MKKYFILVMLSITFSVNAQIDLPQTFKITEDVVSIGDDFTLENGFIIKERVVNVTSTFELMRYNKCYGSAKQKFISIGSKISIFNENDVLIGSVEEEIFKSFGVYSKYNIYDKNGKKIAYSEKHQLMSTNFEIKNMSNKTICSIKRPAINMISDTWYVSIKDNQYDMRLFLFIPCYKTHRDNQ